MSDKRHAAHEIPRPYDFRSDTVTRPTSAMRHAMASCDVGDDVFGDDPTVNALESEAAELFGKEAALLVPSGTMANLIAILLHCRPGDEALVEERSHTLNAEQGGASRFAGVVLRALKGDARGALDPAEVARAARGRPGCGPVERLHVPRTALVCLENTHNYAGGRVTPVERVAEIADAARSRGLAVHMDGARIMNAVVASGTPARGFAAHVDTLACCLSKGLCAPVGSVLVGSRALLEEGRRIRKVLGGGMRQAGVLAACGRISLSSEIVDRLAIDHTRAKKLAEGLARIPALRVDLEAVETNMVYVRHAGGAEAEVAFSTKMRERGVLAVPLAGLGVRFVTHRDVDDAAVDVALAAAREAA